MLSWAARLPYGQIFSYVCLIGRMSGQVPESTGQMGKGHSNVAEGGPGKSLESAKLSAGEHDLPAGLALYHLLMDHSLHPPMEVYSFDCFPASPLILFLSVV